MRRSALGAVPLFVAALSPIADGAPPQQPPGGLPPAPFAPEFRLKSPHRAEERLVAVAPKDMDTAFCCVPVYLSANGTRFAPTAASAPKQQPIRWAYVKREGGHKRVVTDGREGPAFDALRNPAYYTHQWPVGPDGRMLVYAGKRGGRWQMVLHSRGEADAEDTVFPAWDAILLNSVCFSPCGLKVAYAALDGSKVSPVVMSERLGSYDAVKMLVIPSRAYGAWARGMEVAESLEYSADRDREGTWEDPIAHGPKPVLFSPDGGRVAWVAREGDSVFAVVDGREGPRYRKIHTIAFSADGKHFRYWASLGQGLVEVVDGVEGQRARHTIPFETRTSADGMRLAYRMQTPDGEHLVVDDRVGAAHGTIRGFRFSPDGPGVAYWANTAGEWMLFLDDIIVTRFAGTGFADNKTPKGEKIAFLPDGKGLAHTVRGKSGEQLYLRGRPLGPPAFSLDDIVFSADGAHIAWVSRDLAPADPATRLDADDTAAVVRDLVERSRSAFMVDGRRIGGECRSIGDMAVGRTGRAACVAYDGPAEKSGELGPGMVRPKWFAVMSDVFGTHRYCWVEPSSLTADPSGRLFAYVADGQLYVNGVGEKLDGTVLKDAGGRLLAFDERGRLRYCLLREDGLYQVAEDLDR